MKITYYRNEKIIGLKMVLYMSSASMTSAGLMLHLDLNRASQSLKPHLTLMEIRFMSRYLAATNLHAILWYILKRGRRLTLGPRQRSKRLLLKTGSNLKMKSQTILR